MMHHTITIHTHDDEQSESLTSTFRVVDDNIVTNLIEAEHDPACLAYPLSILLAVVNKSAHAIFHEDAAMAAAIDNLAGALISDEKLRRSGLYGL